MPFLPPNQQRQSTEGNFSGVNTSQMGYIKSDLDRKLEILSVFAVQKYWVRRLDQLGSGCKKGDKHPICGQVCSMEQLSASWERDKPQSSCSAAVGSAGRRRYPCSPADQRCRRRHHAGPHDVPAPSGTHITCRRPFTDIYATDCTFTRCDNGIGQPAWPTPCSGSKNKTWPFRPMEVLTWFPNSAI